MFPYNALDDDEDDDDDEEEEEDGDDDVQHNRCLASAVLQPAPHHNIGIASYNEYRNCIARVVVLMNLMNVSAQVYLSVVGWEWGLDASSRRDVIPQYSPYSFLLSCTTPTPKAQTLNTLDPKVHSPNQQAR